MRQEMHAETVQQYVRAAGYKLQRGLPLFLRRGMMGSHIFLVHVWDAEKKEYIPLIFKYHNDHHLIPREVEQYRRLKGALNEALVSLRSAGRNHFLLVEYVPDADNLADILREGQQEREEDVQHAVRTVLQFMTYAWTTFSLSSPRGVPTVYRATLRRQQRSKPFGDLGYQLKKMLGRLRDLPIVVNGCDLGFTAMDAMNEIHASLYDVRLLDRERLTHGDLNPGNILVARGGTPRIIDCRAVQQGEVGEDWVRDLAYLARCQNTETLQAYEGEAFLDSSPDRKLMLNYKATFAPVTNVLLEICRQHGAKMSLQGELCDPEWERRFWFHIAAASLGEVYHLGRRLRLGVIRGFPNLPTFMLGEAFLAVARAKEVRRKR